MTRKDVTGIVACFLALFATAFVLVPKSSATVCGLVRGIVHDPQHHPVNQARVMLEASDSGYKLSAATNADGEFQFDAVPLGQYTVNVAAPGFAVQSQFLQLTSGSAPILHYQLALAARPNRRSQSPRRPLI